jgi:hypothetical protein
MSDSLADLRKEALVDSLIQMIRGRRVSDAISVIDSHEDPIAIGSALNSIVKKLYREYSDVTDMIVAGNIGFDYCLRKSAAESSEDKIGELKKLGKIIAFNTAANCWPGWGDPGINIEEAHLRDGIKLATQSRDLVQELALGPRELPIGWSAPLSWPLVDLALRGSRSSRPNKFLSPPMRRHHTP